MVCWISGKMMLFGVTKAFAAGKKFEEATRAMVRAVDFISTIVVYCDGDLQILLYRLAKGKPPCSVGYEHAKGCVEKMQQQQRTGHNHCRRHISLVFVKRSC